MRVTHERRRKYDADVAEKTLFRPNLFTNPKNRRGKNRIDTKFHTRRPENA